MRFLRAFFLALASSTAVASLIIYVRWILTLSPRDKWLRDSMPLQFHFQRIEELLGVPLLIFIMGGLMFIVPAFIAWALVRHFNRGSLAIYLLAATASAAALSSAIAAWPDWETPITFGDALMSVMIHSLPPCLVGGWVFWRSSREIQP